MRKSENLYRTSTPSLLLNIPFLPKSIKAFSGFFRNYVPIFHQTNFSTRCAGSKRAGFSAYSPLKRSASPGGAPDRFFSRTEKNGALLPQEKWSNPRNKSTRGSKRPAPSAAWNMAASAEAAHAEWRCRPGWKSAACCLLKIQIPRRQTACAPAAPRAWTRGSWP